MEKQKMNNRRSGFSLIELLIAVVVLGILSAMLIAGGTSAQNKARASVAGNDIDSFKNAVYQALMTHPEVMKYRDVDGTTQPTDFIKRTVDFINEELDESFRLTYLDNGGTSGGVAYTTLQRDPWGNPYGVYIYTDTNTSTYPDPEDATGTAMLEDSNSMMYIVLVSAGPNGSGAAAGVDGSNIDPEDGKVISGKAMVNNTDGIDDLGTIIRIKNGSTFYATFGADTSSLGKLKGIQWVFGKPNGGVDAPTGICYDFKAKTQKSPTVCGSIDKYPDEHSISSDKNVSQDSLVGKWS